MVFSDLFFLYVFIPVMILCYAAARLADRAAAGKGSGFCGGSACNCSNAVLTMFSLIFYAWGEPVYVFLMVGSVLLNYIVGRNLIRFGLKSKTALVIGLVLNIGIIAVFKYADFLIDLLSLTGINIPKSGIKMPIGISFFTFQLISYIVDVYRGDAEPQRSFFSLLLYISMFPQLIAGPIVRYSTISSEIKRREITLNDVSEGSFRFLIGLGKKVIFANQLSELSSKFLDGSLAALTTGGAWVGIIAYTLQIYFDFSGYSDMAIGMGRCLGFHFDENFRHPYISRTITDFWRRWHISLGSFFRDYVYIPLGGNRRHQPLNLLVVWFLTGLWHGASWNFVLWGLYFGVIIVIEKFTIIKIEKKIPAVFLHIYSLFIIVFGWVIFYFKDFSRLGEFIPILFGGGAGGWDSVTQSALTEKMWLIAVGIVCCLPLSKIFSYFYGKSDRNGSACGEAVLTGLKTLSALAILVVSSLLLVGGTANPFLYMGY